ncbi:zinc finger CCCH domain-containing protein 2-like [Mercurialis annua]|uniref:zinc finger CCCH domain-containing protein 2-like n=1 Tax=Mercurialis annua TaxID=3986 RepID=UPI0021605E06|nr:zinc finger CCCH domain-containing protein 2-like [Mercurialis annua]
MSTICAEQHKLFNSFKKSFKDNLEIPPRKLLFSKKTFQESSSPEYHNMFESNLHKFLPRNDHKGSESDDQDLLDPYSSDQFRMYEFKVRRCTRSRSHDWTDCPFAHPGEKARRRDPRKFNYAGTVCPEFRRGGCSRGDSCEFAHGVFECWLHPSRYRTEACKDGKNCKRKVCFFAHSPLQLRILPEISCGANLKNIKHSHCCCSACHSVISSPTSTLLGMSHMSPPLSPSQSLSPPLSPVKQRSGFSPISRYNERMSKLRSGIISYKDVLTELMSSLEAMNVNEAANNRNINSVIPWIDIASLNGDQDHQFILSPSTPNGSFFSGDFSRINNGVLNDNFNGKINYHEGGGSVNADPDLGWVNDLLM